MSSELKRACTNGVSVLNIKYIWQANTKAFAKIFSFKVADSSLLWLLRNGDHVAESQSRSNEQVTNGGQDQWSAQR